MKTIKRPYHWHAVYTNSRAEKKVFDDLQEQGIECYLPIVKELRQWSDRQKWVEKPLITSYLFVRVSEREYYDVLNTNGAVCYVSFGGKATPIPEQQIDALKLFLQDANRSVDLTRDNLAKGSKVEVLTGPLKGIQGEVIQLHGQHRIVLRFETLGCCIHTNINLQEVKKVEMEHRSKWNTDLTD